MEDVDIRYENGVIYMIKHKTDDTKEFYIGSSYDLKKRCWSHKSACNNENNKRHNLKVYKYIRENGGWDEWEIILLYDYPCKNRNKLELEEQLAVKKYKSTLNTQVPCRTNKEYREDNKEKKAKIDKEYYKNNRNEIIQKSKEHYENNREKHSQYKKKYQEANKEKILQRNKEHYETNKEEILQKAKIYNEANKEKMSKLKKKHYEANKEKILQKLSIKINCDICNAIVCKHHIERHKKSQKCINYFKKN